MTRHPVWVILCRLLEKGRREIEETVEDIKERDRVERKMNESEETEEIKTVPYLPLPAARIVKFYIFSHFFIKIQIEAFLMSTQNMFL